MTRHLIPALAVLAVSALASAQTKQTISTDGRPSKIGAPKMGLNLRDRQSIRNAAVSNLLEIKTSEVALKRGQSRWARRFAKDMITDHSAAHEELKLIARKHGVSVPKMLPPDKAAIVARLNRISKANFDEVYRQVQIMGHRETAMKFEIGIQNGREADVRNYLIKSLPAVKAHLKAATEKRTMTHSM